VDLNRELLSRIKNFAAVEELHNVEVLHGDAEVVGGTGLPSDTFDFVIATNLLFAVENRGECAAEIRRILKKSGRALVVDWQDSFSGLGPHAGHVITAAAGQRLLEQQGMVLVAKVPAGAYHWGLVVRKKSA
jgi:ubiquinone/menaquinone biosynthesis C-methylase UbiE